jgi:hypothetical protein
VPVKKEWLAYDGADSYKGISFKDTHAMSYHPFGLLNKNAAWVAALAPFYGGNTQEDIMTVARDLKNAVLCGFCMHIHGSCKYKLCIM